MEITLEEVDEFTTNVKIEERQVGVIKVRDGHLLCYSKGRHTTTKNITEVIYHGFISDY